MVASSSGATSGRSASSPRASRGASASSSGRSTGSATVGIVQPPAFSRLRAGLVGDDQLRLGEVERVAHLVGLPPAVDQGGDRRPPSAPPYRRRSRPGSCASRSRPGRPWRRPSCRRAPAPAASPARRARRRSAAPRRRPPPRSAPLSAQKASNRHGRVAGRLVTIARPSASRPMPDAAALADHLGQDRVIFAVELARHPSLSSLCLLSSPLYEGASLKGEALIDALLTSLATASDAIRWTDLGARSGRARLLGSVPAALVQPRLSRRHRHRLVVSAEAARAARRADGPAPCRRHGLLRDARHHPRRPARLCPVLQAARLSRTIRSRSSAAVGRRHVVPRRRDRGQPRHPLPGLAAEARLAAHPRLCRLLRPVRPVPRPPRQFRERRAVGRARPTCPGRCASRELDRRPAPCSGPPRHPSQLYEAVLEGILLFLVLWYMFWKTRARYQPGKLVGAFILVYGLSRFLVEFVREPDAHLVELRRRRPASTWASGCRCR